MTPDTLQTFLNLPIAAILTKVFLLILIFLYLGFAAIIVRQVRVMNQVLTIANFSPILQIISIVHLILALGLFAFTFFVL